MYFKHDKSKINLPSLSLKIQNKIRKQSKLIRAYPETYKPELFVFTIFQNFKNG